MPRPRVLRSGRSYIPTNPHKVRVAWEARAQWPHGELDGPVTLTVLYVSGIPPSWPRQRREAALAGRELPFRDARDLDNLLKFTLDALEGVVYANDRQVVGFTVSWRYGAAPGTTVYVSGPATIGA